MEDQTHYPKTFRDLIRDDCLIEDICDIIAKILENIQSGTTGLSRIMTISRVQLYRWLFYLTGKM